MSHTVSERIPLIRLRGSLLVSIQVALGDQMVVQLRDDISQALTRSEVQALIIDVSGIDLMDSYIARAIRDIAMIAELMGVQTALCGIDPMIAMTLVEMGVEFKRVSTFRELNMALEHLDKEREQARSIEQQLIDRALQSES